MTKNNNKKSAKPIWERSWFRVISVFVIIIVLILTALPFIISNTMKSWLLENVADSVSIENIDFNPFTGTATVYGLDVRINDHTVISSSRVYLDVSLAALFKKGIIIKTAALDKVRVTIEQTADGKLRIGSLLISSNKTPGIYFRWDENTENKEKDYLVAEPGDNHPQ
mgnify:CR=1 FL=1